jgi:hypothetical protein
MASMFSLILFNLLVNHGTHKGDYFPSLLAKEAGRHGELDERDRGAGGLREEPGGRGGRPERPLSLFDSVVQMSK